MNTNKKPNSPTVWVGECVCGLTVYETANGKRFIQSTGKPHKDWHCTNRRKGRDEAQDATS